MMKRNSPWLRCLCALLCLMLCAGALADGETIPETVAEQPPEAVVETPPEAIVETPPEEAVQEAVAPVAESVPEPVVEAEPVVQAEPPAEEPVEVQTEPIVEEAPSPEEPETPPVEMETGSVQTETPPVEPPAEEPPAEEPPAEEPPAEEPPAEVPPAEEPPVDPAVVDPAVDPALPLEGETVPGEIPGEVLEEIPEEPTETDATALCADVDCPHIRIDDEGNVTSLCPMGEWLLRHYEPDETLAGGEEPAPDENAPMLLMAMGAPEVSELDLTDGTRVIYRSGSYLVRGGGGAARLTVMPKLSVSLRFEDATLRQLTLSAYDAVGVSFTGRTTCDMFGAADSASVVLDGSGVFVVGSLTGAVETYDGCLRLPEGTVSLNGRSQYTFPAAGTHSCTVDGGYFSYERPDYDKIAYLWLPPLAKGLSYKSRVEGETLVIYSEPDAPVTGDTYSLSDSAEFAPVQDGSYSIVRGDQPIAHTLNVGVTGVSLKLDALLARGLANVTASEALRLHLTGASELSNLSCAGKLTLTGSGSLSVDTLTADALSAGSGVTLRFDGYNGACLDGWQAIAVGGDLSVSVRATYAGESYALAFASGDPRTALLPLAAPESGKRYQATLNGNTLEIQLVEIGASVLQLTDAGLSITADGEYEITRGDGTGGDLRVAAGVKAKLLLRAVATTGRLTLDAGAQVALTLSGANGFDAGTGLGDSAALTVGGDGALRTGALASGAGTSVSVGAQTNLTLGEVNTLPGSGLVSTQITVLDADGNPRRGAAVSLRIGAGAPFSACTDGAGMVRLWAPAAYDGQSVVVRAGENSRAGVVEGARVTPAALPRIEKLALSDSTKIITFEVDDAQVTGVQYWINPKGETPDAYDPNAKFVRMADQECVIPDVKAGDRVVFRAFACKAAVELSEATADAFQFSDVVSYKEERPRFSLNEQSKEYDKTPFSDFDFNVELPSRCSIRWYQNNEEVYEARDVGVYVAKINVHAGSANYLPGVTEVRVTITKRMVLIYPADLYTKQKGQPDPVFEFFADGLLEGDELGGWLGRESGENYGNYTYLTDWFSAPSYYELEIDPESPYFFIDWNIHHYLPYDPLAKIDPVHQQLRFSDGKTLDLILKTTERLSIEKVNYGNLLFDTEDGKARPFTPTLRLKHGYDEAMLLLEAEPELNKDGGYATDADGNRLVRGRSLTLSPSHLNHLESQRIRTVALSLDGMACLMELSELTSERVKDKMRAVGVTMRGTRFRVTLEPVGDASDVAAESAATQRAVQLGMRMTYLRVELVNGKTVLDITAELPSLRLMADVSALLTEATETSAEISEVVIGHKENAPEIEVTVDTMELALRLTQEKLASEGCALWDYGPAASALDSKLVVPYTASETEVIPFTAAMMTHPYLIATPRRSGLYGLSLGWVRE